MTFRITFKKSVYRDLKKLPREEAARILDTIEEELPEKADKLPVLKGKFQGLRKFRVGSYRVIFVILEDQILILRISHRRESYR